MSTMHETEAVGATRSYLVIGQAGSLYCLEMLSARSVLDVERVAPVPGAAPGMVGVVNVGGRVLALADLAIALQGSPTPAEEWTTAIVLDGRDGDEMALAVLADVVDVVELGADDIQPPPAFGLGASAGLVTGVVHLGPDRLGLVLDPDRLVDSFDPELPA